MCSTAVRDTSMKNNDNQTDQPDQPEVGDWHINEPAIEYWPEIDLHIDIMNQPNQLIQLLEQQQQAAQQQQQPQLGLPANINLAAPGGMIPPGLLPPFGAPQPMDPNLGINLDLSNMPVDFVTTSATGLQQPPILDQDQLVQQLLQQQLGTQQLQQHMVLTSQSGMRIAAVE